MDNELKDYSDKFNLALNTIRELVLSRAVAVDDNYYNALSNIEYFHNEIVNSLDHKNHFLEETISKMSRELDGIYSDLRED